jgi:hypothetical protein
MQVDTEPFPINMIDFDGKKVLIRPRATDKGKGKEVIIGDTRKADENNKNSCRKVVVERTADGGETQRLPSIPPTLEGRRKRRQVTRRGSLCCASWMVRRTDVDGLGHCRTVRIIPADSPATPKNHDGRVPSNHDD